MDFRDLEETLRKRTLGLLPTTFECVAASMRRLCTATDPGDGGVNVLEFFDRAGRMAATMAESDRLSTEKRWQLAAKAMQRLCLHAGVLFDPQRSRITYNSSSAFAARSKKLAYLHENFKEECLAFSAHLVVQEKAGEFTLDRDELALGMLFFRGGSRNVRPDLELIAMATEVLERLEARKLIGTEKQSVFTVSDWVHDPSPVYLPVQTRVKEIRRSVGA